MKLLESIANFFVKIGESVISFFTGTRKGIRKISPYAAALLVLAIPTIIVTLFITSNVAKGAWYDTNYDYRVPVTITYSGSTLSNHDVVIELDTATLISGGKMQSDCDDIRVTDSDETTGINYWVESGCNTSTTQIWARVPSIPDGGKTIYIYYGYASATNSEQSWTGKYILMDNGSCPTGWTTNSGAAQEYNAKFPYGAATQGGTGGGTSHNHGGAQSFTWPQTGSPNGLGGNITSGVTQCHIDHTHGSSSSITIGTTSSVLPPYLDMVFCTATNPQYVKSGLIALHASSTPTGWTRFSSLDNKLPRGAASYGGTSSTSTHTHSYTGSTTATTACPDYATGASGGSSNTASSHNHTANGGTTDAGSHLPQYRDMIFASINSDGAFTDGIIVMTDSLPPLGWTRYSNLDNRYPRGASSPGGTGGSNTHTHGETVTTGGPSTTKTGYRQDSIARASSTHTHSYSLTTSSSSSLPPYVNTIYAQRNTPSASTSVGSEEGQNSAPNTPSLDSPTDTATGQSWQPALKTTATDPDSDYIRYKIELCEDVSMIVNCQTFDQTISQTGWSGQNAESSTAYTSGTQGTYTVQSGSPLDSNTTYYWRSYAIDPGGKNEWSSTQGTPYSFTTDTVPIIPLQCTLEKALDNSYIDVNWVDNSTNESGFEIERSDNNGAFGDLDTVASNTETYQDSTIADGNKYEYRVNSYTTYGSTTRSSDWCYASLSNPATGRFKINYIPSIMNLVSYRNL